MTTNILQSLIQLVVVSLAVSAISMTTAKSELFQPLRLWLKSQSQWLGSLVSCPYCTSHWVAIFFTAVYQPVLWQVIVLDQIVFIFAIVTLASFWSGLIFRAYAPME